MHAVPAPFVAYLRVYEPLSTFAPAVRDQLVEALRRGPIDPGHAGVREQRRWLHSQLVAPSRLLPGEAADGTALSGEDVLVIDPGDVPTGESATVGPGPLVCPLDLRGRSAAALVGFLTSAEMPLRGAVFPDPEGDAKSHANRVVQELSEAAVHVLSSTWTVPLPWFALVDPTERIEGTDSGGVSWLVAMADARRRVARAHTVSEGALGDQGPTRILRETGRWLEKFHPHSAVELDYGGLVQLMTAEDVQADTSAEDVHAIIDAMERGESTEVAERYEALRDFWAEFAARERYN